MSKWGMEEVETLTEIEKINFTGDVLDIAAGDGRFLKELLRSANTVTAIDINENELRCLNKICPDSCTHKLNTIVVDILKPFPFKKESFDGIFCTGTLHLFQKDDVKFIFSEIKKCLKPNGKILFDFATNIKRYDKNGNEILFSGEGCYETEEAISFLESLLEDFNYEVVKSSFSENDLDNNDYSSIKGDFLIISGFKK